MAKRSTGERRAEFIARARIAIDTGISQAAFLRTASAKGFSVRRTTMMSDWRNLAQLDVKKDLFKYVRKDYYPTAKVMAQVDWRLSQEYMFKVKVTSRVSPGEPLTERFVNIMSDIPMTPEQVAEAVEEKWREWEKYQKEIIEDIVPVAAVHQVME